MSKKERPIDVLNEMVRMAEMEMKEAYGNLDEEIRKVERVVERLKMEMKLRGAETLINSLGELQGLGARVDVACARFVDKRQYVYDLCAARRRIS